MRKKDPDKLRQSSVFGAGTTGRGREEGFVLGGLGRKVMGVFQEEGSLELGKESGKRAFPGRGRNVGGQDHRGR